MKELTPEQIVEIRDEVFNSPNPRAKAEDLAKEYTPGAIGDALQIANTGELPTNNINAQQAEKRKRCTKPGYKKSPKTLAPVGESPKPAAQPKAPKTVALAPQTATVLAQYLEGSLQRDIREGLGGDWTLNDIRLLLFAQHQLATYGEE